MIHLTFMIRSKTWFPIFPIFKIIPSFHPIFVIFFWSPVSFFILPNFIHYSRIMRWNLSTTFACSFHSITESILRCSTILSCTHKSFFSCSCTFFKKFWIPIRFIHCIIFCKIINCIISRFKISTTILHCFSKDFCFRRRFLTALTLLCKHHS